MVTLKSDVLSPRAGIARLASVQHAYSNDPPKWARSCACFWGSRKRYWRTAGTMYVLSVRLRLSATCVQVSSHNHETWGRCLNVRTFQILSTKAHSILFCNPVAKAFAKQIACCCWEPPYKELCTWPWALALYMSPGNLKLPFPSLYTWYGSSPNFSDFL